MCEKCDAKREALKAALAAASTGDKVVLLDTLAGMAKVQVAESLVVGDVPMLRTEIEGHEVNMVPEEFFAEAVDRADELGVKLLGAIDDSLHSKDLLAAMHKALTDMGTAVKAVNNPQLMAVVEQIHANYTASAQAAHEKAAKRSEETKELIRKAVEEDPASSGEDEQTNEGGELPPELQALMDRLTGGTLH